LTTKTALTDTSTTGDYAQELKWSNDLSIYMALLEDDTLRMSDSVITAFYDSCFVANMGKLVRASNGLSGGKDLSDFRDTLNALNTSIVPEDVWRDVLVIAYDHLLDSNVVADSAGIALNQLLATVFPDSSFTVTATKKPDYSSIQLSTLQTIAAACPYEYGVGVYMARTILSARDTVLYTGMDDCELGPRTPSERRGDEETNDELAEQQKFSEFVLYPNPSTGDFTISLNLDDGARAQLYIWSVEGQLVQVDQLNIGDNRIKTTAAVGFYLYTITINDIPKWNGKVLFTGE
jgi:hypothetical protein